MKTSTHNVFKNWFKAGIVFSSSVLLTCSSALASVPITFKVGESKYYKDMPCIVKVAFKYHNQDLAPLISSPIGTSATEKVVNIAEKKSEENNILEHVSVYILRVGKNRNVDAIANSTTLAINTKPSELKEVQVWFEKDQEGNAKYLRSRAILKN